MPTPPKFAFRAVVENAMGPGPSLLGVLKASLIPQASDGSLLSVQNDSAGNFVGAQGTGVDGKHRQLTISGDWPNQQAFFSENDAPFFHAMTYLEQISVSVPHVGTIKSFIFYYTVSTENLAISYEVIPATLATMLSPNDLRPFAAAKYEPFSKKDSKGVAQTLWHPTAAARGVFQFRGSSFPWLSSVDPASVGSSAAAAANIFVAPTTSLDWDITLEGNFKSELARAAYFAPLRTPSGGNVPPFADRITVKSFLWEMLVWCAGGAFAGLTGGPLGAPFGCVGGAIASGLSSIYHIVTDPTTTSPPPTGPGAETGNTVGAQGTGVNAPPTPPVDEAKKKKVKK